MGMLLGGFGLSDRGDEGFFFSRDKLPPELEEERPRSRLGGGGGGPLLPPLGPGDRVGGGGGGPLLVPSDRVGGGGGPLLLPGPSDRVGGGGGGPPGPSDRVGGGGGGPPAPPLPPNRLDETLEFDIFRPTEEGGAGGVALVGGGGGGPPPRIDPNDGPLPPRIEFRPGGGGGGPFLVGGGGPALVGGGGGWLIPRPPEAGRGNCLGNCCDGVLGPLVDGGDVALVPPILFPTAGPRLAIPTLLLTPDTGVRQIIASNY